MQPTKPPPSLCALEAPDVTEALDWFVEARSMPAAGQVRPRGYVPRQRANISQHVTDALHVFKSCGKEREAARHMVRNKVPTYLAFSIMRRSKWRDSDPI